MSLMDSLLLEPMSFKTPTGNMFFIARRNDGALGSGTMDAPFDGSTEWGPLLSAALELGEEVYDVELAWVGTAPNTTVIFIGPHHCAVGDWITIAGEVSGQFNGTFQVVDFPKVDSDRRFICQTGATSGPTGSDITCHIARIVTVTAPDHGFAIYNEVEILGVEGDAAKFYNGLFLVETASEDTFTYRIPGVKDGPSGTITCQKVRFHFDEVMRSLGDGSVVYLGPGVFETRGFGVEEFSMNGPGWSARVQQKIRGAGMGLTTLKLVYSVGPRGAVAIGHDRFISESVDDANGFEASDFTVDCNMRSQLASDVGHALDATVKAAIVVTGKHVRVRNVRAIDFGTDIQGIECFVIGASNGHGGHITPGEPVDCAIENCVIEQPSPNGVYVSTCLTLSAGESPDSGVMGYHRGCAIRNCYFDGAYVDNPVAVSGITHSGGVATVTTLAAHGRVVGDWVVISGATENGAPSNHLNGSFQVGSVPNATQFTFAPDGSPSGSLSAEFVGRFTSHIVRVSEIEHVGDAIALLTTAPSGERNEQHNRKPGEWILIWQTNNVLPSNIAPYFGRVQILEDGLLPTQFKYRMLSAPAASSVDNSQRSIFAGPGLQALGGDGGSETVVEGNRIFTARVGGPYHDTWSTKDMTVRNNYYSDVVVGPMQTLDRTSSLKTGASGGFAVVGTTATFQTQLAHGLVVGQGVQIASATDGESTPFTGFFAVTAVTTMSFQWEYPSPPTGTPAPGYRFAAIWQVGRNLTEKNIIEVAQNTHPATGYGPSTGILIRGNNQFEPQYVFRRVEMRENILRLLPNTANPSAYAINPFGVENVLVEKNVIDVENANPIPCAFNKVAALFGNQTPTGARVAGVDNSTPPRAITNDKVAAQLEDVFVLVL